MEKMESNKETEVTPLDKNVNEDILTTKSSATLGVELDLKDREIAAARMVQEQVHQEIINLRRKRIDLDSSLAKAKYNYEKLKIERTLIASAFWHNKNQGL